MIRLQGDHKIFQTMPGQGWRVLVAARNGDGGTGKAEVYECPVVAWVTHKTSVRKRMAIGLGPWEDAIHIDPLICGSFMGETRSEFMLFNNYDLVVGSVFLAPGEDRTAARDSEAVKDLKRVESNAQRLVKRTGAIHE